MPQAQTDIRSVKSAQLPLFPLILGGPCAQIPMEMGQLNVHEICTGPKIRDMLYIGIESVLPGTSRTKSL